MNAPDHRKYELALTLNADSLDEIERVFSQIVLDCIVEHDSLSGSGKIVDTHSGGWSSGYSLQITHDPDMTGDRYRDELKEWNSEQIAARRASEGDIEQGSART